MTNDRSQPPAAPRPSAPVDPDPHQFRHLPGEIVGTFVRWIGLGAIAGALTLGIAGLWYFGVIGLAIGVAMGAIVGGVAGLLLLFTLNWPF